MWLKVSCDLVFELEEPSAFLLMLRPRSGAQQWVAREEYTITPMAPMGEYTDGFGNLCQRLVAPAGKLSIHTSADVQTADVLDVHPGAPFVEIQNLPEAALGFLLPSRYCESDRFNVMAAEITAHALPGYDQVAAIETWLRNTIEFIPLSSDIPISAIEVNQRKSGVCKDLAHLGIALCRSLCIPARLVVGYLHNLKPMDMHAWFEAFVGGRWYTFDATQTGTKSGYVAIGYGNDAADVALYNQFGLAAFPLEHVVTVDEIEKG